VDRVAVCDQWNPCQRESDQDKACALKSETIVFMTVTIELPADIEAGVLAQAQAEGLAVSEYFPKSGAPPVRTAMWAHFAGLGVRWLRKNGCGSFGRGRKAMPNVIFRFCRMRP
jgi:hypothetical protein